MSMKDYALPGDAALCRILTLEGEPHLGWFDLGNPHIQKPPAVVDLTHVSNEKFTTVAQALTLPTPSSMYLTPYCDLVDFVDLVALDASASWRERYPHGGQIDPRSVVNMLSSFVPDAFVLPIDELTLLAPIDSQQVWIADGAGEGGPEAGGTENDGGAEPHDRPDGAERPFPFRRGDARHIVGPGQAMQARSGARRTVPGPALAVLLNGLGTITGFTIANDVHATAMESEGSPALSWAGPHNGACALGPWVMPTDFLRDPYALRVHCSISRGGAVLWQGEASTAALRPWLDELVPRLARAQSFPDGAYLLARLPVAPPEPIGLQAGDSVEVSIEQLGTLRNPVA